MLAVIVSVTAAFGFPALAIVFIKYFKMKERELALELEYRQKSQQQEFAIEQRVQRLEDALNSVNERLGIDEPAKPLPSHPDLLEGPAARDQQRGKSLRP